MRTALAATQMFFVSEYILSSLNETSLPTHESLVSPPTIEDLRQQAIRDYVNNDSADQITGSDHITGSRPRVHPMECGDLPT